MRTACSTTALTLIVAALWIATPRICIGQSVGAAQRGQRVLPSVVTLHVQRADGKTKTGTAFLGVRDGLLVTTAHLLEDAAQVTATFPDGEVFDCIGVVDKDVRHNVALVRIREFGHPVLTISPAEMKVGDKASAAVVKDSAFGLVDVGVDGMLTPNDIKFYRLTGQIPDGNNGAPVVNADGAVLGVAMIIAMGGQTVRVALPSTYVLALDPSLAVKPWTSTASARASESTGAAPSSANNPADTALAAVFTQLHDTWAAWYENSAQIYDWTRASSADLGLDGARSAVDAAIGRLQWITPTDPMMAKLAQAAGQILALERQAIGLDIKCWLRNKNSSVMDPDDHVAENDAQQATGMFESIPSRIAPMQPALRQFAARSPAFVAALSSEMRYFLGIAKRKSKIDLGVYVDGDEPMYILNVAEHGLAEKLGLEAGDVIVSAGGRTFKPTDDMDDFALLIQSNAGKTIRIVVQRGNNNKTKTLKKKVPDDVVQKYGSA